MVSPRKFRAAKMATRLAKTKASTMETARATMAEICEALILGKLLLNFDA